MQHILTKKRLGSRNQLLRNRVMDLKEKLNADMGRHPWELARLRVVYNLLKYHMPQIQNTNSFVIDIGCGDIYLVEQLSVKIPKANFIAIDTNFCDDTLKFYRNKFKYYSIQVFNSLEKAFQNIHNKVDLVLLLDVIEHIPDDIYFLKCLQNNPYITGNTIFVITVPSFQHLFCSHDIFLRHYRRYNNKLLKNNINKAGLSTIDMGYYFLSLLPVRLMQVVIERIIKYKTKINKGIGDWKQNKFRDFIIESFLFIDFKITFFFHKIGIKLYGLSNYMICKKLVL